DGDDVALVAADVGGADRRRDAADDAAALAREGAAQRPLGVGLARARAVGGHAGAHAAEDPQLEDGLPASLFGPAAGAPDGGVVRGALAGAGVGPARGVLELEVVVEDVGGDVAADEREREGAAAEPEAADPVATIAAAGVDELAVDLARPRTQLAIAG